MEHLGGHSLPAILPEDGLAPGPDGLLVIQTTVITVQSPIRCDPSPEVFLLNSVAPHPLEILKAAEGAGFIAEDVHNIGAGLERTLLAFAANMERAGRKLSANNDEYYKCSSLLESLHRGMREQKSPNVGSWCFPRGDGAVWSGRQGLLEEAVEATNQFDRVLLNVVTLISF